MIPICEDQEPEGASLRRLNTDYIDLFYLHAWDGTTPVDEVMRAMDDLVRAGKVLYVGISDTPAWQVARMQTIADLRGWSPLVALQIEYSLIERTVERDLIPMAAELGWGSSRGHRWPAGCWRASTPGPTWTTQAAPPLSARARTWPSGTVR
jgi:hypothetical protein